VTRVTEMATGVRAGRSGLLAPGYETLNTKPPARAFCAWPDDDGVTNVRFGRVLAG
jgi:hypothetical protein